MEEPKDPCKTCGGNEKTPSRREFLQSAVVVGAGLSLAVAGFTTATEARAAGFDFHDCMAAAGHADDTCKANAIANNPGNEVKARALRFAAIAACEAAFDARIAACYAQLAAEVAKELAQFIIDHPYVLIPSLIVVAGIVCIILAGGVVVLL